ncbi:hypothetical protein BIY21_08765 [Vibrio ponticus]|uniref:Uncharacterized protein n=1 Tax=Vibrio ponticus TaxID=265668 RepID=A0ABX3FK64_9VIBR|nr:hypothetical protein [Vibrio ponticus]OLQ94565.1 hypothetical protein BIY21_08765 [Vibrio ponticus]
MGLRTTFFSVAALLAVVTSYVFYSPFPVPECKQYSGELRTGEEITTFNFLFGRKTVNLKTTFNQPLQQLGMPSSINYQFQILAVTEDVDLWRYQLKESTSGLLQELEIKPIGNLFSIHWVNDRTHNITYKCTELDDAKL